MLDGKPLAGAGHATLHFVGDQQDAVLVANAAQLFHEDGGSDHVSAFALHRLDKDRRHFFGRQNGLEQLFFNVGGAAQSELLRVHALGVPR